MLSISGVKPYQCKVCGKEFNHSGSFSGHKKRMKECGAYYLALRGKAKESRMLNATIVKNEKPTEIATESFPNVREERLITSGGDLTNTSESDQVEDMLTSLLLVTNNYPSEEERIIGLASNAAEIADTNVQSTENYIPSSVSVGQVTHSKSDEILDSSNMSTGDTDLLLNPVEGDKGRSSTVDYYEKESTKESSNSGQPGSDELKITSEKRQKEFKQSPVEKITPEKPEFQDSLPTEGLAPPYSDGTSGKNTKGKQSVQSNLQDESKGANPRARSKRNAKNSHTKAKRRCSRDSSKESKANNKGTYQCMRVCTHRNVCRT